jgi:predicted dehydrogenase
LETPANSRAILNVALLGYGFAGKTFHAPLLARVPGLRLSHIVSSDGAKVRKDWDVTVLAKPEEAFALGEIDLVVIATPNPTHFDLARKALLSDKNVVVDKPFTNTVAEAEELIALAKSRRRILSIFQNRRWDADFLTLRQLLSEGMLGEVVVFESHYDRFRPEPRPRWREQNVPGGGLWFDLGPHLVDQALQLFGQPDGIYADLEIQRPSATVVDYFHVVLRYARRRVILHGGSLVAAETPRFTVHGTRGSYIKFGLDTQEDSLKRGDVPGAPGWGVDPRMGTLVVCRGEGFETKEIPNIPGNYLAYYEALHSAIVAGAPNPVAAEDALATIKILEAATRSAPTRAATHT